MEAVKQVCGRVRVVSSNDASTPVSTASLAPSPYILPLHLLTHPLLISLSLYPSFSPSLPTSFTLSPSLPTSLTLSPTSPPLPLSLPPHPLHPPSLPPSLSPSLPPSSLVGFCNSWYKIQNSRGTSSPKEIVL